MKFKRFDWLRVGVHIPKMSDLFFRQAKLLVGQNFPKNFVTFVGHFFVCLSDKVVLKYKYENAYMVGGLIESSKQKKSQSVVSKNKYYRDICLLLFIKHLIKRNYLKELQSCIVTNNFNYLLSCTQRRTSFFLLFKWIC